jgi:hypothetical protein
MIFLRSGFQSQKFLLGTGISREEDVFHPDRYPPRFSIFPEKRTAAVPVPPRQYVAHFG